MGFRTRAKRKWKRKYEVLDDEDDEGAEITRGVGRGAWNWGLGRDEGESNETKTKMRSKSRTRTRTSYVGGCVGALGRVSVGQRGLTLYIMFPLKGPKHMSSFTHAPIPRRQRRRRRGRLGPGVVVGSSCGFDASV
jgi:hypothetical protein